MTPPRNLWRVEWEVARHPERPNDRRQMSRNFTSATAAGAQVCSVRLWEPRYATLHGVWRTTAGRDSLNWEQIDPESLPIDGVAEARYAAIASSPQYAQMMEDE